jgi:hypothetical protein
MSLKSLSWSSPTAASACRFLSRPRHRCLSFDTPLSPSLNVIANLTDTTTNAPIDCMNALISIVGFMNWTISINTKRLLPVQADFLNHDTGRPQRR